MIPEKWKALQLVLALVLLVEESLERAKVADFFKDERLWDADVVAHALVAPLPVVFVTELVGNLLVDLRRYVKA